LTRAALVRAGIEPNPGPGGTPASDAVLALMAAQFGSAPPAAAAAAAPPPPLLSATEWPELGAALGGVDAPRGARMERRDGGASGSGPRSPRPPPPPPPPPASPPPLRPSQPQQPQPQQPLPQSQQQPRHVHERLESRHGVFAARGGGGAAAPKKPKALPDTPCPTCG
jgi:hypothetical protein